MYLNSADLDEMQHFVALHLGLHCFSKCSFRSQWFNIHVQVSIVAQDGRKALSGKQKSSFWHDQTESPDLAYSIYICKQSWTILFCIFLRYYLVNCKIPCEALTIRYAIYCERNRFNANLR